MNLAPNGKPSNLTPEQYALVRTPAFKAWFGDWENDAENYKMILNENGEPKVLWRGDSVDFNVFDLNKTFTEAFWFTPSKEYGSMRGKYNKPYFIKSDKIINLTVNSDLSIDINSRRKLFQDIDSKNIDVNSVYITTGVGSEFDEYVCFNPNNIKLADGTNTTFDGSNPDIRYENGGGLTMKKPLVSDNLDKFKDGGSISRTPAPKKDRIYGSSKNKPKSSESKSKASSIILSPTVIKSINTILKEHNEDFPKKKIPLSTAKAVVRRGMGAFSSSYRPTISGGKPNSRVAWGLARLKAFVYKIQKGHSKSGKYKQDNDLIDELGYKHDEYKNGGEMQKLDDLYKDHHNVWAISEKIIKNVCEENCSKYSDEIHYLYELELKPHFIEEEKVFFPSVINENNKDLIKELIKEHHLIKFLVQKIKLSKKTKDIKDFCNLMIEHIKKEELIMKTISDDPYKNMAFKNGGNIPMKEEEYKYFLVTKNQKPVFKVKFSKYKKETERDMSEMLDKLYDMDYILKSITEQEYKDFDYGTVDKEDIAEFTKNWSYYKNGGKITDERKETYKKWKSLVNMSSSELKKFLDSEEGKVAGLSRKEANELGIDYGRESARWILRMKDTPYSEWTPNMWRWAKKQISFISRMSGNKGKLFDENGKRTRKYLSLLVWGNNPLKK